MAERQWSPTALSWLCDYAGSIDSTALLMAFEAGARSGEQRLRDAIEAEAQREDEETADILETGGDLTSEPYHEYAARVLRSLLSDAPEAGREE